LGLLTYLLTFPVSGPIAGIQWSLHQVQRIVDDELTDDTPIKQELMELQMRLEMGEIDDGEYRAHEATLMTRLREVRAWRERLGRETSGGPVRVARSPDEPGGSGSAAGDTSAPSPPAPPSSSDPE
jgi:hypothetical protein